MEWTKYITNEIDEKITHSAINLYTYKYTDCISSPDVKNALNNIHKGFVVVPLHKAIGNIALVLKRCYVSVIAKELGLYNNSCSSIYSRTNNLSSNDIIDKNIRDLKTKFDFNDILVEIHRLLNMHWTPKMKKNFTKVRSIISSPKSSIKHLAGMITSNFRGFFR